MRPPKPTFGSAAVRAPAIRCLVLGAALLAGCAAELPEPRHVFLITVDTLRADHLGLYGYPRATSEALEELAQGGVVFERAIAQWPKTGPSFASIFTGRYPQTTGLTHRAALELPAEYLTLPELMAEGGFDTAAVVSNGVLRHTLGWSQGFDEYLETWTLAPEESEDPIEYRKWINALRVNELALPLLERLKDSERLFLWLHYSDPHAPYYLPEGVENPFLGDPWDVGDAGVKLDPPRRSKALGRNRELRYYVAHYDANVRLVDQKIREVLDRARELGLLDDALIVFTADHGESLGEHGYYFGHGRLPYNASAHVPLVIAHLGAGGRGRRIGAPVELVDLYPTLRRLAAPDLEVPGLEGDSLVPFLGRDGRARRQAEETFRLAFSQAGGGSPRTHFRSVQDARFKLIYHPARPRGRHRHPVIWELYRLDEDPMETRNLLEEEPGELRRLQRELSGWMKGTEWIIRRPDEIGARSQEAVKALRALGYLE